MKKLRLLFCLLVVVCIIASSSTFSAMPQGKFPIRVMSSRDNPNQYERELTRHLEKAFNNSPNFRLASTNENRIILIFLLDRYNPGIVSSDVFASATPINTFSLVWFAKPKDKYAHYLWHTTGSYKTYEALSQFILQQAEIMVQDIKKNYSYIFD
jgi:hypothetical protein